MPEHQLLHEKKFAFPSKSCSYSSSCQRTSTRYNSRSLQIQFSFFMLAHQFQHKIQFTFLSKSTHFHHASAPIPARDTIHISVRIGPTTLLLNRLSHLTVRPCDARDMLKIDLPSISHFIVIGIFGPSVTFTGSLTRQAFSRLASQNTGDAPASTDPTPDPTTAASASAPSNNASGAGYRCLGNLLTAHVNQRHVRDPEPTYPIRRPLFAEAIPRRPVEPPRTPKKTAPAAPVTKRTPKKIAHWQPTPTSATGTTAAATASAMKQPAPKQPAPKPEMTDLKQPAIRQRTEMKQPASTDSNLTTKCDPASRIALRSVPSAKPSVLSSPARISVTAVLNEKHIILNVQPFARISGRSAASAASATARFPMRSALQPSVSSAVNAQPSARSAAFTFTVSKSHRVQIPCTDTATAASASAWIPGRDEPSGAGAKSHTAVSASESHAVSASAWSTCAARFPSRIPVTPSRRHANPKLVVAPRETVNPSATEARTTATATEARAIVTPGPTIATATLIPRATETPIQSAVAAVVALTATVAGVAAPFSCSTPKINAAAEAESPVGVFRPLAPAGQLFSPITSTSPTSSTSNEGVVTSSSSGSCLQASPLHLANASPPHPAHASSHLELPHHPPV